MPDSRVARVANVAVLAAFGGVALWLAAQLGIWIDESFTLHTTAAGPLAALRGAIVFEWQAPLYFFLLDLWRHANDGILFARSFSVLCILAALALVPGLARRYAPGVAPTAVLASFACAPFMLWAAEEIRSYALLTLLTVLFLRTLYDEVLAEAPHASWMLVPMTGAAIATHYFALPLVFGAYAAALMTGGEAPRRYLARCGLGLAIASPLLFPFSAQLHDARQPVSQANFSATLRLTLDAVGRFLMPLEFARSGRIIAALAVGGISAIGLALVRARISWSRRSRAMLAMTAATLVALVACLWLSHVPLAFPRYATAGFAVTVLLPFALFANLPEGMRTSIVWGWTLAICLAGIALDASAYRPLAKEGDCARVAAFLREHDTDGDAIVAFKADDALALEESDATLAVRIVPLPEPLRFDEPFNVADVRVTDATALHAALHRVARPHGRIWLVQGDVCEWEGLRFGCDLLDRELTTHWRVLEKHDFFHAKVRLIEDGGDMDAFD